MGKKFETGIKIKKAGSVLLAKTDRKGSKYVPFGILSKTSLAELSAIKKMDKVRFRTKGKFVSAKTKSKQVLAHRKTKLR